MVADDNSNSGGTAPTLDTMNGTNDDDDNHPQETTVQNMAWRDALGRSGLFSGTAIPMEDDGGESYLQPFHGTVEYMSDEDNNTNTVVVVQYVGDVDPATQHWQSTSARITYRTGDVYQGAVHDSQKHGYGVYTWKKKTSTTTQSYAGHYLHDMRHGQGTYHWPDGSSYTGSFERNQRQGYGTYQHPSRDISYIGQWKAGVYHGHGTYQYPDTEGAVVVYTGEFVQGVPQGRGREMKQGRVQHDGLWHQGQPVSAKLDLVLDQPWFDPTSHFPAVYRGLWNQNHQPEGNGTAHYSKGPIVEYEGCWKNGRYHGQGRVVYASGDVYTGVWEASIRQGTGTLQWKDGRQYTGDWEANVRTGSGVFTWPSGDRYEGEFVNGQRSGSGMFVFGESGAYYAGEWKQGVYHGTGKMVDASGACYSGEFMQGQRHGSGEEFDSSGRLRTRGKWVHGEYQSERYSVKPNHSFEDPTPSTSERDDTATIEDKEPTAEPELKQEGTENEAEVEELPVSRSSHPGKHTEEGIENDPNHLAAAPSCPPPPVPGQALLRGWDSRNEPSSSTTESMAGSEKECVAVVDQRVTDGLGCPGLYTGLVLKGQPHGVGRLVYEDGKRIHEGFWVHGTKEGHGRCLFTPQQDFHEGEYKQNLRHGPGRYSVGE